MGNRRINESIFNFWNNFLNFKKTPKKNEVVIINHDIESELTNNELYYLKFLDGGSIISVGNKYSSEFNNHSGLGNKNLNDIKNIFSKIVGKKVKILGPMTAFYLFDSSKLLHNTDKVKLLDKVKDKKTYQDFLLGCTKEEINAVDINMEDRTHKVFGFFVDGKMTSLGNYSIEEKTKIAHIGIITPSIFQKKGYGKKLVNDIVLNILKNNLIPQYRVYNTNVASRKIAESLGFTPILETATILINN